MGIEIDDNDARLSAIEALALSGQMGQALALADELGSLSQLRGGRARCLVAWIWDHLGDGNTASRVYSKEFKRSPEQATVRFFHTHLLLRERGPLEAWLSLRDYVAPESSSAAERAELCGLRARLLAYLGDSAGAEAELADCDVEALGEARYVSTQATLLERREKRAEALALLESALRRQPLDRTLVQHVASLLERSNRRGEALELLREVAPRLDFPMLASQLAMLEHECLEFEAEERSLRRFEALSSKSSRALRKQLSLRRAENCYLRGDFPGAALHAQASGEEYYLKLAKRLPKTRGEPDRKQLKLPVLIQEPMGCAPSSLAIISSYFGAPVDQVDVADQICYEGTASHSERGWVEARGWISREFTVDFATARRLIERDVPFLLVTVDIASAHAQVVIGFDATRGSLIVRDPSTSHTGEIDADQLFERHRAYGPRGHVILPPELAARLSGIELPEAQLHDAAHRFRLALETHDEATIAQRLQELAALAPGHALELWARRALALRNEDPYATQACSEALLQRFPDDANAEVSVLDCLGSVGTEAQQRQRLDSRLSDPKAPWIFRDRLARLLSSDAGEHQRAKRLALRALRQVPMRGRSVALWAALERDAGQRELSLCLRRMAATLEPTDADLGRSYFEEAFGEGQPEPALQLLRERSERYGDRSGEPVQVLFGALEWLDRMEEAFSELERGCTRRPEDGQLLLFAAEAYARYQQLDLARSLLARARGKVRGPVFEQAAARIAEMSGDLPEALARHSAALELLPFSLRSRRAVAYLTSQLSGLSSARETLAQACQRYPAHCGLRELYIGWLRGHDPGQVLNEIDALLALQPLNTWARRERALTLSDLGEHARAQAEAEAAAALAPTHPASQRVLCAVLTAAGQREAARVAAERAVQLWPDGPGALAELLGLASSLKDQLELTHWAWRLVLDQSVNGDGLVAWYGYATGLVPGSELLELMRELWVRKPGLWTSHHLLGRALLTSGQPLEARTLLEAASERFAFSSALLLDLADACRACGDFAAEARAAQAGLQISPGWNRALLRVAEVLEREGKTDEARRVLERGLHFHPRNSELKGALAQAWFRAGQVERAFEEARQAVEYEPEDSDAWYSYSECASLLGKSDEVAHLAQTLAAQRPWNAEIWLRLAEVQRRASENLSTIAALEQALERRPDLVLAIDTYALALTHIGKKAEALAICERPVAGYFGRGTLRARRAWVRWQFNERDEACLDMRKVIADHPDQLWGLQELVQWEAERKQHASSLRLAEALVKLSPLRAVSYGFLGDAQQEMELFEEAWQSFTQAAQLDPSYVFVGSRRVQLAIAQRRFDAAEAVIAEQGPHVSPHVRTQWQLQLAVARTDSEGALDTLRRLAASPTTTGAGLVAQAQVLQQLPLANLKRGLSSLACDSSLHAELGELWVATLDARGAPPSAFRILRLRRHHEQAFQSAARAHFELLGDKSAAWFSVLGSLLLLGAASRKNDVTWGKIGFALTRARAYVACQIWLSDYARRSATEAWMLHNYRICALENHQRQSGLRAAEHALTLPTDGTLHWHLAFSAFAHAANGNISKAREIVEGRSAEGLTDRHRALFEGARLLVALSSAARSEQLPILQELSTITFGVSCFSLFSAGTLQRWLASGVLRQSFSWVFFWRRWGLWFAITGCVLGALLGPAPLGAVLSVLVLQLLPGYYVWLRVRT